MNYYKRYVGDYARDTAHLSLMEHGAYTVLLDTMYATGKPLPPDIESLCRICRASTPAERRAVQSIAEQFFPVNGDGTRHNKRADEELGAYVKQAEANRQTAIARERKRKEHEASTNRVTDRVTNGSTNDQPKPEARSHKEQKSKTLSAAADGAFAKFWHTYPRKTAKAAALRAWKKLNPDEGLLQAMLEAIERQKKSEQWQRGVLPHPATWLNDKRWEDELALVIKPAQDTTCQRVLPGTSEKCGMPGKPHPVYRYSCEHCNRKDDEALTRNEIPAAVREQLQRLKRA